jgi:hypothetical protein
MQAFLAIQRRWLELERLPAYAPDLNPAEGLWSNLKGRELANRRDLEVSHSVAAAQRGVRRIRGNQHPRQPATALRLPPPNRPFSLTKLSLHYANVLSRPQPCNNLSGAGTWHSLQTGDEEDGRPCSQKLFAASWWWF